jgi:AraC-like DNA-binding protein
MRDAAGSLATGRLTLLEVASRAGYGSEAAFAQAFKRRFGLTPGSYRADAGRPLRIEVAALIRQRIHGDREPLLRPSAPAASRLRA